MPKSPALKPRRNPLAKALRDPRYHQRTVKVQKGHGSYRRHARQDLAPGKRGQIVEE
ncbi:MAG TPA: alternative ribosome rescue factor ArfA [Acetobacteraceae bacterium]|nr:alternative ribosome rescue factor ArfA [Acetobacteraceae bacterium]